MSDTLRNELLLYLGELLYDLGKEYDCAEREKIATKIAAVNTLLDN